MMFETIAKQEKIANSIINKINKLSTVKKYKWVDIPIFFTSLKLVKVFIYSGCYFKSQQIHFFITGYGAPYFVLDIVFLTF
jgi:hypothetical protein